MRAGLGSTLCVVTKMPPGCNASSCKALGLKSIPVDLTLVVLEQVLVQLAWLGPWCPHQLPRLSPSVLVWCLSEQLRDLVADHLQSHREVVLQRPVPLKIVVYLLIELLEGVSVHPT